MTEKRKDQPTNKCEVIQKVLNLNLRYVSDRIYADAGEATIENRGNDQINICAEHIKRLDFTRPRTYEVHFFSAL